MSHLNFKDHIILENDRARLEPLNQNHFELLLPFSLNEPELWTYALTPGDGEDNLKAYMSLALQRRIDKDSYAFLIYDKRTNEVAGTSRFYDYQSAHSSVQLGYTWYGKKFQGTGLNKNCKFLMLEYAFDVLNLERVEFRADANNARSIAAMKSLGCKVEGILRSNCASPSGRRDSIVLSILKHEWNGSVKELLTSKL